MPGIIGTGTEQLTNSIAGLGKSADLEVQRDIANKQNAEAARQANMQLAASGAGIAACIIIAAVMM
jgi:hypothetical protein